MYKKIISEKKQKKDEPRFDIAEERNNLAVHHHICEKCGYDKAQLIECGIEITDEDCRIKYKCGKCGYVEDVSEKPR